MGVSWLAQCALDFLIEERCHACNTCNTGVLRKHAETRQLSAPVIIFSLRSFRLGTRLLCESCASAIRPWSGDVNIDGLSAVYPAFNADKTLLTVIHLLKFARRERIAPWLAQAMAQHLPDFSQNEDEQRVLIPVPMDRASQRKRGFNQAERIARELASIWKLPLDTRALTKIRATKAQSTLGREERLTNVDGAFQADSGHIHNADVILVDDLVTTGSTLRACASALRRAGARRVSAVCAGYRDETPAARGALPQS